MRDSGPSMVSCWSRLRSFSELTRTTGTKLTTFHYVNDQLHPIIDIRVDESSDLR